MLHQLLSAVCFINVCYAAEILMITLGGTKSHKIPFLEVAKGLIDRSHNITLVSGFPSDYTGDGRHITEVTPRKVTEFITEYFNRDLLGSRMRGELPISVWDAIRYPLEVCSAFYEDETTQALMQLKFDVAIIDGAFPECAIGLAYKTKTPFIYLNTVAFYSGSLARSGNPTLPAFTPAFSAPLTEQMSFYERAYNGLHYILLNCMHYVMAKLLHMRMRRYLGDIPHPYDISSNVSFILQNGHPVLTYSRPYLANVAEIACVHCKPAKPLPDELEEFIGSNNTDGFIYVSMGSSVMEARMPNKLRRIMVEAFSRLPYKVLWKWESNTKSMRNIPKHIKLAKWFPQQDILGHKNIKAFVTHGGLLSMFETVYHACPIVTIPVFCDHDVNAAKAVQDGYALKLNLDTISSRTLAAAIENIVKNETYKKAAETRRSLLLDQMVSPKEIASFYIEYVLRHNGADHLLSSSRKLNTFEYYFIDVSIFYAVCFWSIWRIWVFYHGIQIKIKTKTE